MPVDNVGRPADSAAPYSLVYPIDPYPYIVAESPSVADSVANPPAVKAKAPFRLVPNPPNTSVNSAPETDPF